MSFGMVESTLEESVWKVPRDRLNVGKFLQVSGYDMNEKSYDHGREEYLTRDLSKKDSSRTIAFYHESLDDEGGDPEIVELIYNKNNPSQVSEVLELRELLVRNGVEFEEENMDEVENDLRRNSRVYNGLADRISKF